MGFFNPAGLRSVNRIAPPNMPSGNPGRCQQRRGGVTEIYH